jgi:uncharacterized delta-60 repeat protein
MIVAALAGLFAFTSSASAKPQLGDLDGSFGAGGVARTSFPGYSVANAVAIDDKGRIVAAGANGRRFALARYKPSGHRDHSFSGDGKVFTPFGDSRAFATDVAVGPRDSIVVAGSECQPSCEFAVARYRPDGRLDPSFGDDGTVTLGFPGTSSSLASGVAFDSKGRVLVTGRACPSSGSGCEFALSRLDRHGKLDPSFGKHGRVLTQFENSAGSPANVFANAMAIDSRGRIVLGGFDAIEKPALARYKPNGALDKNFGRAGTIIERLRHLGEIGALAIDGKDRIVAVGDDRQEYWRWALARFGKDGRIDSSFGQNGQVSTVGTRGRTRDVIANALAIDSRNRIVVAGTPQFSLIRYKPGGHLDKSFGDRGKVWEDFGNGGANGLAIDSRDRPVVAGSGTGGSPAARQQFTVARFLG